MNGPPSPKLVLLPAHADPLDWAARQLIAAQRERLPDLSHLTLILPASASAPRLRRLLARHAGGALLGPAITTLSGFAARGRRTAALSALDCKLILADALRQFPGVFPGQDAWALAESLFSLFEDLSANSPELALDEARFLARVEQGYRAGQLAQASLEARFVHPLWRAYLRDTAGRSPAVAQGRALRAAFGAPQPQEEIWLIGFDALRSDERAIVRDALQQQNVHVLLHGPMQGRASAALAAQLGDGAELADGSGDPFAAAFDDGGASLRQRMAPLPSTAPRIRLAAAAQPEHEARLVDLAVRQALLGGVRDIVVVTQDRRLARRLRALLERAGVALRDEVGWALSTSAAAASLGHWLDCCEQNFSFRPLLDLLKSGFYNGADPAEVATLETRIYRSGVASGLERLRKLDGIASGLFEPLTQALKLLPSLQGPARNGNEWSHALLQSLQALPLWQAWQNDDAGAALLQQLEDTHAALLRQKTRLDWAGFRRMLERTLETATFLPQQADGPVRLLTLEQAQSLRCEFLILAGASAAQFPGRPAPQGLFNHAVRAELGLPHWCEDWQRQLGRFRALLHAAPQVLMTYAPEQDGEDAEPCPWIAALRDSGYTIEDAALPTLAMSAGVEIAADGDALPLPQAAPKPAAPVTLLPASISASAHQALITCPYQFFAGSLLGLRAWQEPDEPVDRSDYGERVHRILQAFHENLPGLPEPFAGIVSAERRDEAAHKLGTLSQAVFAADLRSRALARLWLSEFRARIPDLVGWMIERSTRWPQIRSEAALEQQLAPGLRLHGRVDRLERNAAGAHSVVDYKTGFAPQAREVENGEAVQATHYALLAEPCDAVEYLRLGREDEAPEIVEGDALTQARTGVRERLVQIFEQLRRNAELPAQGDELSCSRCDFIGVCRNGTWHE